MKKVGRFLFLILGIISFHFANCQTTEELNFDNPNTEIADDISVFTSLKAGDVLLINYQKSGCFHFESGNYKIYQSGDEVFVEKSENKISNEGKIEKVNNVRKKIDVEKLLELEKVNREVKEKLSKSLSMSTNSSQYSIYKNNIMFVNRLHYNPSDELLTALNDCFKS
jgi:hypothetical protein